MYSNVGFLRNTAKKDIFFYGIQIGEKQQARRALGTFQLWLSGGQFITEQELVRTSVVDTMLGSMSCY